MQWTVLREYRAWGNYQNMRAKLCWWATLVCSVLGVFRASAQTNGIFADFTTSLGTFTCQLSYSNAPKAVANFIGLATGERPWLDLTTGQVRSDPFYDGLTFHRVIKGFMDQTGSRNSLGTDGPGYAFVDEFSSLLTFNTPWVLGMANSGPDSNGSQFFVTVEPYTSGNNVYTVFGRVVSGTNVVAAINQVGTDANDKPLTNVYLQRVTIRRVGDAALAFDINAHGLPVVTNLPLSLVRGSGSVSLLFSNRSYADNRLYSSTNLTAWTPRKLGIEIGAPSSNSISVPSVAPEQFFRFAQVQYPSSTLAPKDVLNRTLTLNLVYTGGKATNTIGFNSSGGGTYALAGSPSGTVTSYSWSQQPYNGLLYPINYSGLYTMSLDLNFSSLTDGTLSGTVYSSPSFSVTGTFKLAP
jgi:peptidyl-prolyl cis-trans isomerase A (cyclophilin A)